MGNANKEKNGEKYSLTRTLGILELRLVVSNRYCKVKIWYQKNRKCYSYNQTR